MSTITPLPGTDVFDEGVLREGTPDRPGRARHIWITDALTADPHNPGFFWLVQRIDGSWVQVEDNDYQVEWQKQFDDDPTITRIMYAEMDENGNIKNRLSPAASNR